MKYLGVIIIALFSAVHYSAQGEYEAEEFVSTTDLQVAIQEMKRSKYIGTQIACEKETPELCDSADNILFESNRGHIKLPVNSFYNINHYTKDTSAELSSENLHINRLIIQSAAGEKVNAIAEGEVTAIFQIPGNGKVIIIKMGSYRMVYSSLSDINLEVGDIVFKNQLLGKVADIENGKVIFEIWKSENGNSTSLPIENWLETN